MNEERYCEDPLLLIDGRGRPMELRCDRLVTDQYGKPRWHHKHEKTHKVAGVEEAVTTWKRQP